MLETFSTPQKVRRPKRKVPNDGRPTKQTPELVKKLCAALAMGLNDEESALVADIASETFRTWKRDPLFVEKIKRAVALRLYRRLEKIEAGGDGWQGTAWCLERLYASRFAKPEIQLAVIAQSNMTENHLTIQISGEQYAHIEAQSEPVRQKVAEMFRRYRPETQGLGHGGESTVGEVEAQVVAQQESRAAEQAVLTHKGENDAQDSAFWKLLVTSNPDSLVRKETAVFVIRAILLRIQGYKAHRTEINFSGDPITIEELFNQLEKLCGGSSGWQTAQRLAGY